MGDDVDSSGFGVALLAALLPVPPTVPVQEFVRHAQYSATKISPDGRTSR